MTRPEAETDLEAALADLGDDTEPLEPAFRARLLADAARVTAPPPRRFTWRLAEMLGLAGLPAAALAGLWLGIANPALVLRATPWQPTEEADLLSDVFVDWSAVEEAGL